MTQDEINKDEIILQLMKVLETITSDLDRLPLLGADHPADVKAVTEEIDAQDKREIVDKEKKKPLAMIGESEPQVENICSSIEDILVGFVDEGEVALFEPGMGEPSLGSDDQSVEMRGANDLHVIVAEKGKKLPEDARSSDLAVGTDTTFPEEVQMSLLPQEEVTRKLDWYEMDLEDRQNGVGYVLEPCEPKPTYVQITQVKYWRRQALR